MDALYSAHAAELRRYLLRLCRDPALADDLLHETFRKACAALPAMPSDLTTRPWLYAIATNTARSAARAAYWRRTRGLAEHDLERPDQGEPVESRSAAADLIDRALAALKPDDAALMLLHWRVGFTLDELRAATGLSRDALKKRLYRAKKAFSAAYARECAYAEGGR
jgi:RNA polymerase sigma factor (sigma-70 family)